MRQWTWYNDNNCVGKHANDATICQMYKYIIKKYNNKIEYISITFRVGDWKWWKQNTG